MRLATAVKNHFKRMFENPLLWGSLVMFVGTNIHNTGQLLYHYLAINLLSKAHYGDLAALVSIFGLLAIIQQSLGLAVVKFIASTKDDREASNLARWIFFWSTWVAAGTALLIFVLSPFLSQFLHISQSQAVYLFTPVIFIGFISNTGRALLQGFIKFALYAGSMIIEVTVKIALTVIFLYAGYELFGAVAGLLFGVIAGLVVVWFSLKAKISGEKRPMPEIGPLVKYSLPVLIQSLAVTSMYSMDVILVKHYFHPDTAGAYAALAKFGTIALFAAAPITSVMFPLVAKKHSHGEPYHKIFYLSLFLITAISGLVVLLYALFGSLITQVLTGGKYVQESYLLWWFGLYMLLLGASILFTQFYLSIGKTKIVWLFATSAIMQIVLIYLYHSTLLDVIQVSIAAAALLVVCLSIYFPYHDKKGK